MPSLPGNRMLRLVAFILGLLLVAAFSSRAAANTFTWSGSNSTAWDAGANWVGGVPTTGSVALFNGSGYLNQPSTSGGSESVGAVWEAAASGSLSISGTCGLTFTGTTLVGTVVTGIEMDSGAGGLSISAPLTVAGAQTWLANSANPLIVSGNVVGSKSLTTSGAGTVVLSGSDLFSATLITYCNFMTTGTVNVTTGSLLVSAGTFTVGGGSFTANTIETIGDGAGQGAVNMLVSGGTFQQTGGALYLGEYSPGILSISGGLVNLGTTTLNFDVGNHGNAGTLTLNGGTLEDAEPFTSDGGVENTVNFNGGVFRLTARSANLFATPADFAANVEGGGVLIDLNGYSTTITNDLVNSGGTSTGGLTLTSASGGTLTLSGSNNYAGPTFVQGGTLILASVTALPDGSSLIVGQGASSLFAPADGTSSPTATPANAVSVPEPNTLGLLLAAAILMSATRVCLHRRVGPASGGTRARVGAGPPE
jgi:fibronectin-binding autotransporter adhesin